MHLAENFLHCPGSSKNTEMSFTVTPNCSVLVTNTNNEDGDGCPHKYWTIYYCFNTSWTNNLTDTVLLMVFMQWINR